MLDTKNLRINHKFSHSALQHSGGPGGPFITVLLLHMISLKYNCNYLVIIVHLILILSLRDF